MLDKTKVYDAHNINNSTIRNCVKILYEDSIGYFVESLVQMDSKNNGIRWSIKKAFYKLIELQVPRKSPVCWGCPLRREIVDIGRRYDI